MVVVVGLDIDSQFLIKDSRKLIKMCAILSSKKYDFTIFFSEWLSNASKTFSETVFFNFILNSDMTSFFGYILTVSSACLGFF